MTELGYKEFCYWLDGYLKGKEEDNQTPRPNSIQEKLKIVLQPRARIATGPEWHNDERTE